MVGSSKILTVSYGTFSCTLEGFEDSFGTMKEIAEYFRDLAADDRHFGAEPITPDADLLAKMAERSGTRRVEASRDGGAFLLKATDAEPLVEDAATAEADSDAPAEKAAAKPKAKKASGKKKPAAKKSSKKSKVADAPTEAAETKPVEDEVAEAQDDADGETPAEVAQADTPQDDSTDVAASETADDVTAKADDTTVEEAVVENTTEGETVAEDDVAADATSTDETAASDTDEADAAPETASDDAPVETPVDLTATDQYEEDYAADLSVEAAADSAASELPSANSVSAKLQRIRAVVSRQKTRDITDVSDRDDDVASTVPDHDDLEGLDTPADADSGQDAINAVQARMDRVRAEQAELDAQAEAATEAEDMADLARLDGDDGSQTAATATAAATPDAGSIRETLGGLGVDTSPETFEDLANEGTDDSATSGLDLSAAAEDTADAASGKADEVFSGITDDDAASAKRDRITGSPEDDADDMARIMAQTDAKMSNPDTSRRRNAISQLKAAVAATEAARELGDTETQRKSTERTFRDDMKQAVRPTRPIRPARPTRIMTPPADETTQTPQAETPQAETPAAAEAPRAQPAPLKLVASQRIEVPNAEMPSILGDSDTSNSDGEKADAPVTPRTPVRSRRIVVPSKAIPTDAAGPADTSSFASFASDMGAENLSDLLEAAAAYSSYVEGAPDFSRPQLMAKIKDVPGEDHSREEGLRAFGTLLREGKIVKVSNGRFQVSEDTAFHPERRTA